MGTTITIILFFVLLVLIIQHVLFCSLGKNYGGIFSLKLGSFKFVMASTPEAVKEMLVTKSVDYAGRPKTYGL